MRDFAKMRIDRANARMNAKPDDAQDAQKPDDPVARLRERADNMAASAAAMKKIADAADPLYKTLDDGQKRRLAILTHMEAGFGGGWRHRGFERGMMGGDRDRATAQRPRRSRSGSDRRLCRRSADRHQGKAAGIRRLFRFRRHADGPGKPRRVCWTSRGRFAKRRPLAKAFRAGSGRIAQLVEQMTLNHRVPGSSPGAPTKLFNDLAA